MKNGMQGVQRQQKINQAREGIGGEMSLLALREA
jgi:hypothetical protein